jgi:Dyp-type peroxidase family
MHQEPVFKGRSLGFSSDLSIAAPLRRGLVPALDAVSYKTRAQRLLDTLHLGRMRNHEHAYARLFSDAVERVGVIQSVRVAVLEPEDKLLLTVSFDGNWDAYIRTLWVKVGGLLDVIFCNTEGYVEARLHPCEAWAEWVRTHQVQTHFFYGSTDGSATDLLYLRRQERLRQDRAAEAPEPPPGRLPPAEQRARQMLDMTDATIGDGQWPRNEQMVATMLRQGLQSLAGLHRLADWYVPGTPDGEVLHRAAHELLQDFTQAWDDGLFRMAIEAPQTQLATRFARQIDWLFGRRPPARKPLGGDDELGAADLDDVQGGILKGYDGITHGALLLFGLADAEAGGRFLATLRPLLHAASQGTRVPTEEIRRTLFITLAGLRRLGLDDAEVEAFPEAFVQGMAARAGLLGDRHDNHPERWRTPLRHAGSGEAHDRIDLAAVHVVVYVRINGLDASLPLWKPSQPGHPLSGEIARLERLVPGAALLAVEPLRRLYREPEARQGVHEHFGFADGNGQPGVGLEPSPPDYPGNNQPFGEFLLGHPGRGDVEADPDAPGLPGRALPAWLHNSSFLVLRKYRQWPDRFDAMLRRAEAETGLGTEVVAAELMGRDRQGRPLVRPGSNSNRFTYLADPDGRRCPLHAHVRRANPRRLQHEMVAGEREPRILRRSVSYGPRSDEDGPDAERGLMFMAFNADIAEQFEVVQRWLAGGHATHTSSGIACPIVGVPEPGRPRRYEFEHAGRLARITLDGEGPLLGDAQPLVRLEWGAYWLAPSLSAIDHLARWARSRASAPPVPFSAERGRGLLQALANKGGGGAEDWKLALEDAEAQRRFDTASLWAAVRHDQGGVMQCPMGVLVGSRSAVSEVLRDPAQNTTVAGYAERMHDALGTIFLGLDDRPGSRYRSESDPVRRAIEQIAPDDAFEVARRAVHAHIKVLVDGARAQARLSGDPVFELVLDEREWVDEVLARLCERWFGIDNLGEPPHFRREGYRPDTPADRPSYPGHFMAPSRHIFQPEPEALVEQLGQDHARALKAAMARFLAARSGRPLQDPGDPGVAALVGQAVVDHPLSQNDPDFAARTMVGAIMGFVPTLDGALRAVVSEWRRSGELARLRARHAGAGWDRHAAEQMLGDRMDRALQLRCVPDIIWRRAAADFELEGVPVQKGQTLVLGLGSAAQASLEQGQRDDSRAMFGGVRDATGVPTHACPGYAAARAAMLGALAALVNNPRPLQELPGGLSWRITGPSAEPGLKAAQTGLSAEPPIHARVLCWGDSWVDYRRGGWIGPRVDLLEMLGEHHPHYTMEGRGSFASFSVWGTIEKMVRERGLFMAELEARLDIGEPPGAILLSGGGNDSTGDRLKALLLPYQAGGPYLKPLETQAHIAAIIDGYRVLLKDIDATFRAARSKTVPVLMHGYDHPFPNWSISAWLKRPFESAGYDEDQPAHWLEAAEAMRQLIAMLNEALATLAGEFAGFARHVDLQGTIAANWQPDARAGWDNELHPTPAGFRQLAEKVDLALQAALREAVGAGVSHPPLRP